MYLLSALQGHGTSSSPSASGAPSECRQGTKSPSSPSTSSASAAHPGHDPHRGRDVGRVGQLDADVRDRRAEGAHRERHDVHRPPLHRALEEVAEQLAHLGRVAPVVVGAGVDLVGRADEGPVLDAGDVAGVGASEVGVGALGVGELLEGPRVDELLAEEVVLLGRAVAPVDRIRLRERCELLDPLEQLRVGRGRRVGADVRFAHWCCCSFLLVRGLVATRMRERANAGSRWDWCQSALERPAL